MHRSFSGYSRNVAFVVMDLAHNKKVFGQPTKNRMLKISVFSNSTWLLCPLP